MNNGLKNCSFLPNDHDKVIIDGVIYKYSIKKRVILHNERNKQYCIFLGTGMNSFIRVQPIKKSGEISIRDEQWASDSNWYVVGEIEHYIAYEIPKSPNNIIKKAIYKLLGETTLPVYQWTQNVKYWTPDKKKPLFAFLYM